MVTQATHLARSTGTSRTLTRATGTNYTLVQSSDSYANYLDSLLAESVWWIDAHQATASETIPNLGTGGTALDALNGGGTAITTNDATFLEYDPAVGAYLYLTGVASNTVTTTAPVNTANYLATKTDNTTTTAAAAAGAFTFSTVGSWKSIALRDAGNVVLTTVNFGGLTTGSQTTITGSGSETWTINRSTAGKKSTVVHGGAGGGSLWLLGTDDYLEVADDALLDFGASDSFTVLAVVRQWATPPNQSAILAKGSGITSATAGYTLIDTSTSSIYRWTVGDAGGVSRPQSTAPDTGRGVLTSLVGAVNRDDQTIALYLNGTNANTGNVSAMGSFSNSEVLRVGRLSGAGTNYTDAEFTAALIWRRALTVAEITAVSSYFTTRTHAE